MSSSIKPTIHSISSADPLFSTLLSFFALILLSFPRILWRFLFSPVFLLTGFLLLSLLRLGATKDDDDSDNNQSHQPRLLSHQIEDARVKSECSAAVSEGSEAGGDASCACFEESFVQWNVRAPLEVIYEEYGEGEDLDKDVSIESDPEEEEPRRPERIGIIERYPSLSLSLSLSLYYPETSDSDSSSEDEFPAAGAWDSLDDDNVCFMWDDDEDRDELIEIALDCKTNNKKLSSSDDHQFQLEEENLIEIDISPTRNAEFSDVKSW